MLRYIGDSGNLRQRVRQHCIGNVESSALRKTIATEIGFEIVSTVRPSGSRKITVALDNAEQVISDYIQSGTWKVVVCHPPSSAKELQWYAIDKLRPPLNKGMNFWDASKENVFSEQLETMLNAEEYEFEETSQLPLRGSGVYSWWHEQSIDEFVPLGTIVWRGTYSELLEQNRRMFDEPFPTSEDE
jgi:hypothetical protein